MNRSGLVTGAALTLAALTSIAETRYVNLNSPASTAPYTNWASAARTIQDAVDASGSGDTILVTNGVYTTGGRAVFGAMVNRVAVDKAVDVRSVNGPEVTIIKGNAQPGTTNGGSAIRCVYVGTNAALSGFTLADGHTQMYGDDSKERSGGGAWCEVSAVISNCVLVGNSASSSGGGAYAGTLNNCTLATNWAYAGGGAYSGILNNCTLAGNRATAGGGAGSGALRRCGMVGNSAYWGGGADSSVLGECILSGNSADAYGGGACTAELNGCVITGNSAGHQGGAGYYGSMTNCTVTCNSAPDSGGTYGTVLNNCIVYYNSALFWPNYSGGEGSFNVSYSCATPLPPGPGNIDAEPLLASISHLSAQSPCIGRGCNSYSSGVDIDGERWLDPPCMGADQFVQGWATGPLSMSITADYTNVATGFTVTFTAQNIGSIAASAWDFGDGVKAGNGFRASHAWSAPGFYTVRLTGYNDSWPDGVSTTLVVRVAAREVYYVNRSNSSPLYPYTNWAGAAVSIQQAIDAGTQIGRLVRVADGIYATGGREAYGLMASRVALAEGVEVRSENGPLATIIEGQAVPGTTNGAASIRCAYIGSNAVLSGFTLTNGHTRTSGDRNKEMCGGGACCEVSSVLTNCILTGNSASAEGGGAWQGTLYNCALIGNSADMGAGTAFGTLHNCSIIRNSARFAAGAYFVTANNCTLAGNSASTGGGAAYSSLNNCIMYYNSATQDPNASWGCAFSFSCSTPLPPGLGNIAAAPRFVDTNGWADLRLQPNSPCINAGLNAFGVVPIELGGNSRIVGGTVDMGAYEFQSPASCISYAWLQSYGLAADGSADNADPDSDGMSNWQEWRAGTNPTNSLSLLQIIAPSNSVSGVTVTWQSVSGIGYYLQRGTNLVLQPAFLSLQSNIVGQAGTTSYTDTNAASGGPFFYRVGVQ